MPSSPGSSLRPTIYDVAARAGVSKSTVSRVLRGNIRVSPSAVESVNRAVEDLQYVPTAAAQSMRAENDAGVGLLLRNVDAPSYSKLNKHLHLSLREYGYNVIQETIIGKHPVDEAGPLEHLLSLRVRGIIVASGTIPSSVLKRVAQHVPLISVGRPEPDPTLHNVAYDQHAHGMMSIDHLHRLGHSRVVIETVPSEFSVGSHIRGLSALSRARELDMKATQYEISNTVDYPDLIDHVIRKTQSTALVCSWDSLLYEAWRQLRVRGFRVPEDISLFGSDGMHDAVDLLNLSTIRLPVEEVAQRASRLMAELVEGSGDEQSPHRETVTGWVLEGGTTGPPART